MYNTHTTVYYMCVCVCVFCICLFVAGHAEGSYRERVRESERPEVESTSTLSSPFPPSAQPLGTCHALLRSSSCSAPAHLRLLLTPPVPAPHPPHLPRHVQSPRHPPQLLPAPPAPLHALAAPLPLPPTPLCVVGDCLD